MEYPFTSASTPDSDVLIARQWAHTQHMVRINSLQKSNNTGFVSLPKDELEMCGLVDEDGKPDTDIQLLVQMQELGEWHIKVLDEDAVDSSWYEGDGTPDTGVSAGSAGGTR